MGNVNRQLQVSHTVYNDSVVVTARGQVDVLTATELAAELACACGAATPPKAVIADLREVEFLGVQAVARLLDTHYDCVRTGTPFRIIADHRAVLRPLRALGFDETFDVASQMAPVGGGSGTQRENSAS